VNLLDRQTPLLPEPFTRWFASRGWRPRAHQLELLAKAQAGRSALLIAPTGGGKTLAGFLPSLVDLASDATAQPNHVRASGLHTGLHTLYISPLKALAVDVARNLEIPVAEMNLPIRLETRTGDTPASKRQRQRRHPPDMLLTTPEQLALLLASADAPYLFGALRRVILDELHALVTSKRGDLLSLGLARLFAIAPQLSSSTATSSCHGPAIRRVMRSANFMRSSERIALRWFLSTRAARPRAFSKTCGISTRTISRLRCITVRLT
jgi:ATP-dependent helicase Lhr and Lhr-like helicase